jgi:hypothetical protein
MTGGARPGTRPPGNLLSPAAICGRAPESLEVRSGVRAERRLQRERRLATGEAVVLPESRTNPLNQANE